METRIVLTRRAVNELAVRASKADDPLASLAGVRQARAEVADLDSRATKALAALEARLEHEGLARGLKAIDELGQNNQWSQAGSRAQELGRLHLPPEAAKTLTEVVKVGEHAAVLEQVQGALKVTKQGGLADAAASLRQLKTENLPASLRQAISGLRGLAELRAAGEGRWQGAPDVARLKQSLAEFQAMAGDPHLTGRVQQDVAVALFLQGAPGEAHSLLPPNGPPEHAANLLRDMKALLLGEGRVSTWPAEHALPRGPESGEPTQPRPPPGLRPLIPEGEQAGWRPPVREPALAELSPLEPGAKPLPAGREPSDGSPTPARADRAPLDEAAHLAAAWRQQASASVDKERAGAQQHGAHALHLVHQLQHQAQQDDEEDRKFLAEVEALLQRPLTAAERAVAWYLRRQGMNARQIVPELPTLFRDPWGG
jgi:hypothetical protein